MTLEHSVKKGPGILKSKQPCTQANQVSPDVHRSMEISLGRI